MFLSDSFTGIYWAGSAQEILSSQAKGTYVRSQLKKKNVLRLFSYPRELDLHNPRPTRMRSSCVALRSVKMHPCIYLRGRIVTERNATDENRIRVGRA